jgi:hypothetical protein
MPEAPVVRMIELVGTDVVNGAAEVVFWNGADVVKTTEVATGATLVVFKADIVDESAEVLDSSSQSS